MFFYHKLPKASSHYILTIQDNGVGIPESLNLNNLISNAIKYSPEGNPILLRLYSTNEAIYFEVQDRGIGILPEDLESLFQAFQRGRNVGNLSGTGLGLTIAKQAAELHKGEIAVDSRVGCGSTFTLKLPHVLNPVLRSYERTDSSPPMGI